MNPNDIMVEITQTPIGGKPSVTMTTVEALSRSDFPLYKDFARLAVEAMEFTWHKQVIRLERKAK